MAILYALPGGNEANGLIHYGSTGGLTLFDSTTQDTTTGGGSIKYDTSLPAASAWTTVQAALADAGRRITLRRRIAAYPTAGGFGFLFNVKVTGGGTRITAVSIDSSGHLGLSSSASANYATGTTVVPLNTWCTVTLAYTITSTTVNRFKIYLTIDGTPGTTTEVDATNVTLPVTGSADTDIGLTNATSAGANLISWCSSIYIDDDATLADPGDLRCTHKAYLGTGEGLGTNAYDTLLGTAVITLGSRYIAMSERPNNDSNGRQHAATGQQSETYAIQDAATGDAALGAGTLVGWQAWVRVKTASSSSVSAIVDNGSVSTLSTTTTITNFYHATTSATYPTGRFGVRSTGTTTDSFFYEGGVTMVYLPATADPFPLLPGRFTSPLYRL